MSRRVKPSPIRPSPTNPIMRFPLCSRRELSGTRGSGNLHALVAIVQEFGELLARGLVALTFVADDDRMLEQL